MTRPIRLSLTAFLLVGGAIAALLAFAVSPWASSAPDGLERVATDLGFAGQARPHPLTGGPLAGYAVGDVADPSLSSGLAGVIGVAGTFLLAAGALWLIRRSGSRRTRAER